MSYFVGRGQIQIAPRTSVDGTLPINFYSLGDVAKFTITPGEGFARYTHGCPKFIRSGSSPTIDMEITELHLNILDKILYTIKYDTVPSVNYSEYAASFGGTFNAHSLDWGTIIALVFNANGSISTVRTISIEVDNKHILIPTVHPNGYIMSNEEAIARYLNIGENFGSYDTLNEANTAAEALHEVQAQIIAGQNSISTVPQLVSAGLFTNYPEDYCWLRFIGSNVATNTNVAIDLMKVRLAPPDRLNIIEDDFLKFNLSGRLFNEERLVQDNFDISKYGRLMKFTGTV